MVHPFLPSLAVCLGLVGLASAPVHVSSAAARPNVVLIMVDDLGTGWFPFHADRLAIDGLEAEILERYQRIRGHLGEVDASKHLEAARQSMPFLNQIARQGVIFDNAFATAALCAPSRAGLLTGTFQQEWGAYWNKDVDDHGIPADRVVIAEPLKAAGYTTGMIGKWHVAKKDPAVMRKVWNEDMGQALPIPPGNDPRRAQLTRALVGSGYQSSSLPGQHPLDRGFDYYFGFNSHDSKYFEAKELWENHERVPARPPGEFLTDLLSDQATRFVERAVEQDKPFFLYYAPLTLHGGIVPPPEHYSAQFDTGNRYSNEYAGHLLALDEGIRRIFATLEAKGHLANTLFIFTSDNGCTLYNVPPHNAPNRGGKGTGWLGGLNVPLVVWGQGIENKGVTQEIISLADLMPTILDYAGVAVPGKISGRSFVPFLTGKEGRGPRDSINSVSIHSSRWHYFYEGQGENNTRDGGAAPLYAWNFDGKHLMMRVTSTRAGFYQSLPEGLEARVMLFDVQQDRQQRSNLAAQNWDQVVKMDESLREWLGGLAEPASSQRADFKSLKEPVKPLF